MAVVIIGLAAAIAIPYFAKASRRTKLISAAHEIQASLLAAGCGPFGSTRTPASS